MLGATNRDEAMKTVAQANKAAQNQEGRSQSVLGRSPKEFSKMMRAANFGLGSILPEHNKASAPQLAGFRANSRSINAASTLIHNPVSKVQGVSEGNPLMKGKGNYLTEYMDSIKWIQPRPVAY